MTNRILNFAFPITGGSIESVTYLFTNLTWQQAGDIALKAAIATIVGGVIGYLVKRVMDILFKKRVG